MTAAMCMAMLAGCTGGQSSTTADSTDAAIESNADTADTANVSSEDEAGTAGENSSDTSDTANGENAGSAGDNSTDSTDAADAKNTSVKAEMTVEEMQAAVDDAMSEADIDITDMFSKRDLAGTYDESGAVRITLSGKTATCDSSDVNIEDGVVTIKSAGVYILSGTLSDGTIVVDAGDGDKVQLVLDGVSITAADYAAIYAKNADKVFVTLAEGAENSLTVSGNYVQTDDHNVDAVIFAKCDLTLNGVGSLTVKDTTGHGIVSKDDLVVTGGTYTIDSQDHCLNGKDSVRIADGTFNLSCDEDGIHAGNDDQQDGYVYIEGGDINISVGDDAIHAEGLLIITGGDIDISKSYEGIEGYKILVTGGDIDVVSSDDGFNAAGGSSSSDDNKVGFGGGPGGKSDGNTPPAKPDESSQNTNDSTQSTANDTQSSEDSQPQTNSSQNETTGSDNNRPELPENGGQRGGGGMPGGSDAIGGSDMSGGPDVGGVDMDADYDAYILITGGTININADGDGIDSNGYLGITGGSVYVLGPSNNGNGALDYGIYAAITGGEIVAVGGSGMAQGFGDESTQCSALVNFDEWVDVGETIKLADSDGKEVLSCKADKKFNSVVISTSGMKQGETYTLTVGNQSSTFTLNDMTYSEGSRGMQGLGGSSDNGGMQRPGGSSDNGGMQSLGSSSDNGQNDSQNGDAHTTESLGNTESMSI